MASCRRRALFELWAEKFYDHDNSLAVPANQMIANVWFWDEQEGLVREEVSPGVFDELMAMRLCEFAVGLDPDLPDAISLWLSSFFPFGVTGARTAGVFLGPIMRMPRHMR